MAFIEKVVRQSVLSTNLLPQRVWCNARDPGVDVSGIAGRGGQMTPVPVLVAEDTGTDEMRFVRKRQAMGGAHNRPRLAASEISLALYERDILSGFEEMYYLLVEHRDDLLAGDGPIQRFGEDQVRFIARPTRTYEQILIESYHPNVLRDAVDRDRLLDHIWLASEDQAWAALIPAELKDLLAGDVPLFTTRPSPHCSH